MSFEPASQTTRLQDYKTATAPLVVSLTPCLVVWRSQGLVVWRSNAKLNFRNSIFPATALLVVSLTRCLVVWRSQGLVVWRSQVLDIKTRTVFVGKLSMPMYCCIGIDFSQCVYKLLHSLALLWCSCVVRLAVHVQATYVADTYAVGVVSVGVCTLHFQWSACLHSAVEQYHIVVAYHGVALFAVPAVYIFGSEMLSFLSGRAV